MVVLDGVGEQLIEPVGIAELCLAQVVSACSSRIGQSELSCRRILLSNQLVHLSIDTAGSSIGGLSIVQVTLLLHLLVDTHLIL